MMPFFYISVESPPGDETDVKISRRNNWEEEKSSTHDEQAAKNILGLNSRERNTGVLPPVVRYISGTGHHVLLERPPQNITLRYHGKNKSDIDEETILQEMDIALPWTIYAIGLNEHFLPYSTHVYATEGPIKSIDDRVGLLPVTNCEKNGKFCTPATGEQPPFPGEIATIADGINLAYQNIWSSNFNTDIVSIIAEAYRQRMPSAIFEGKGDRAPVTPNANYKASNLFKRWEEFTLEEVAQWRDWPPAYLGGDSNVANVIDMLNADEAQFNATYMYNNFRRNLM